MYFHIQKEVIVEILLDNKAIELVIIILEFARKQEFKLKK